MIQEPRQSAKLLNRIVDEIVMHAGSQSPQVTLAILSALSGMSTTPVSVRVEGNQENYALLGTFVEALIGPKRSIYLTSGSESGFTSSGSSSIADATKNVQDASARKATVQNMTDQAALADVAKNDRDTDVRQAAVEKLTDQALLADIAKNAKDWLTRHAVIGKLDDQVVLAYIVKNDADAHVRQAAELRLKILVDLKRGVQTAQGGGQAVPNVPDGVRERERTGKPTQDIPPADSPVLLGVTIDEAQRLWMNRAAFRILS